MKKITLALALALALTLAACGSSGKPAATATPDPTVDGTMNQPATMPEDGFDVDSDMAVESEIPEADTELAALVDSIYEKHPVEIMMPQTVAIDPANPDWMMYNAGLDSDTAALVDAAVFSESATGSQAYSLVIARVKDAADAQTVADTMLGSIDPAKWICVMADQQYCNVYGDLVVYCMADSGLLDASAVMDAATAVLGEPTSTAQAQA